MSRIGNAPVEIPQEITIAVTGSVVELKGPKGELTVAIPGGIRVAHKDNTLVVTTNRTDKPSRALHGFLRAEIANAVQGVTAGWTKTLELSGVGYRAAMSGDALELSVGFTHPVIVHPPTGISFFMQEGRIIVSGINKQLVGEVAAKIRDIKKPEPYKGKGIKYEGEVIRKKAGKAKTVAGAATGGGK